MVSTYQTSFSIGETVRNPTFSIEIAQQIDRPPTPGTKPLRAPANPVSWEAFNLLVEKLLPFAQARRSELKSPEVRGAGPEFGGL